MQFRVNCMQFDSHCKMHSDALSINNIIEQKQQQQQENERARERERTNLLYLAHVTVVAVVIVGVVVLAGYVFAFLDMPKKWHKVNRPHRFNQYNGRGNKIVFDCYVCC